MNAQTSPEDFLQHLSQNNIGEGYFITQNGQLKASHTSLQALANNIRKWPDFQQHEGVFFGTDQRNNCLFTACVYSTVRGQSAGGVRFNSYPTLGDLFRDGLRLSKGMADKNAIARLWWGGGKGIIYRKNIHDLSAEERKDMYQNYGKFVSRLNGVYVTAEDMNTKPEDMADIFTTTRHTTCIPVEFGGSSNPSIYTAKGVFSGIKAAAEFKYGKDQPLKGKTALLHGAGNVGYHVMEQLIEAGAKVLVFDINEKTLQRIRENFSNDQAEIIQDEKAFFSTKAHLLSPNAIGAILNDDSINNLQVEMVVGGANNQLLIAEKHARQLQDKGIIYLPDFFVNRLGIINCANEQYGYVKADIDREVELVYTDSLDLLEKAKSKNQSPFIIANQIAEERLQQPHPIWGHRGPKLVKEMIGNGFGK